MTHPASSCATSLGDTTSTSAVQVPSLSLLSIRGSCCAPLLQAPPRQLPAPAPRVLAAGPAQPVAVPVFGLKLQLPAGRAASSASRIRRSASR